MQEIQDMEERTPGRRGWDGVHLLKWIPFLSLLFLMIMQTIYVTRYVSGLEASNTQLVATVAEIRAELKSLSNNVSSGAVPNAQMQWRLEIIERDVSALRNTAAENTRRLTALELQSRTARER